jgi:dTDP-glucose pyrophosphorylase
MVQTDGLAWRSTILPLHSSIQDVVRNLEKTGLRIVLLVDEQGAFVGTITDGDIRRGLLRGFGTQSSAELIVHRGAFVVPPQVGRDVVLQLMRANRLQQIPVVDVDGRVAGLHLWEEIAEPTNHTCQMVIMAGGEGRRLHPLTENCPKPMLQIDGKPMLEHIIERAKSEGFRHFVLAIRHLGEMIEAHFGDGAQWDVRIEYLRETGALGTAGALSLFERPPEAPMIVSNGDVLTDIRYREMLDFHLLHAAEATMAVRLHEWQHPFGVVRTDGVEIVGFEEKPVTRTHVNAGVYALNPAALSVLVPGERCDMPTLFERVSRRGGRTVAYAVHEKWLDVGQHAEYEDAQKPQIEEARLS